MKESENYYEILGVSREATAVEIKKAYRKLLLLHHPDKVAEELREESEIRFKEISHAYEVLSDEDKRANYDQFGSEEGIPSGFGAGANGADFGPEDFFQFFNGASGGRAPGRDGGRSGRKLKTEDAKIEVEVTLEDLFKGKVIKTTSTRNIICKHCKGTGTKARAKHEKCQLCGGEGQKAKLRRLGPGIVTQEYVTCTNCNGTGSISRKKDRCKRCEGKKVEEETKILEFNIEKGSKNKGRVVLPQESDEEVGKITGDVILTYTVKQHEYFERKGDDLFYKLNLKLFEALCGFTKKNFIKTLDNRFLSLTIPKGKVLKPGDYIKIPNEGMPVNSQKKSWFSSSDLKGDLYIAVEIEFPKDNWFLEKNELDTVRSILSNVEYPTKLRTESPSSIRTEEELNSSEIEKFTIAREEALPDYSDDKDADAEEHDEGAGYYDYARYGGGSGGYYDGDGAGVEPECYQQ